MNHTPVFDAELIRRYDGNGPRYTSYPTAAQFSDTFGPRDYAEALRQTNELPIPAPLSIYVHLPFCDTVCYYCACNKVITKNRSRAEEYLEYLKREISWQSQLLDSDRKVEQLHFGGGTPTFMSALQLEELMASLRTHFQLIDGSGRDYSIELDPRAIDEDRVRHLADLGFNRFSIGVQDLDDNVQKAINRIQPFEKTQSIVNACRAHGANSINVDLIYGLPHQSRIRFAGTLQRVITGLRPDRLSVFNYAHLPERFKVQRQISQTDLPSANEKLSILQSTIEQLQQAGYVHIGMDHFALPGDPLVSALNNGTLQRNFQGYATNNGCDLVAFGISAIGKAGFHYSQNAHRLEDYYRIIDAGQLPVVRGLRMSEDDCVRAEIIQQLSCRYLLDLPKLADEFGIDADDYFSWELSRLRRMAADELVSCEDSVWQVSAKGRLLIRNICAVFDRYQQPATAKGFSRLI